METEDFARRRDEAAEEFNRHENRADGIHVAGSLADGLNLLRETLYSRVHDDVEREFGLDSMYIPVSEAKTRQLTIREIELYQIAVSACVVRQHGYVSTDDDWYLRWLARFRLGAGHADARTAARLEHYLSRTPDDQRLAFTDVLGRALPEARRAPLVLFRLMPWCVEIATALAFSDAAAASATRAAQVDCLPAIRDCRRCGGRVLENGDRCHECDNPLWNFPWLRAAD